MSDVTAQSTLTTAALSDERSRGHGPPVLSLVVLWSLDEPDRVGEVLPCLHPRSELGRGPGEGRVPRLVPHRMRPGIRGAQPPLASRRLSRRQLVVEVDQGALRLTNVGRATLLHAGQGVDEVRLRPGDAVVLRNALVLGCVVRPESLAPLRPGLTYPPFAFGTPDVFGIVGESVAAWTLREQLAFVAGRGEHVLITGPSGAGKELAASAIHGLGGDGPLVSRNAATFPEGLVDAELFGNIRDYPNPGMPARPGLVGQACGGSLVLDEIGELPAHLQAHLLRVLDDGEYQRLGEAEPRRSRFRLIAATNRPVDALKHDLAARLIHRVGVPGLDQRPEDVPLLARTLLQRRAAGDPWLRERFFVGEHPTFAPELMEALFRERWTTHARQLERLLWEAISESRGTLIERVSRPVAHLPTSPEPDLPDPESIREALEQADWVVSRAWRVLGLRNRYQLARLMKQHGIERP